MSRRLQTIADEDDALLRAVRDVQMTVEQSIEGLRMVRASLDNEVANLLEQRRGNRIVRLQRLSPMGGS
jgi:hypothetical protein